MFEYLYEWLQNLSFYLILVTAVTYVLPSNSYRKYIRFFTGLVLILMLLTPVLSLFGMKELKIEYEENMPKWMEELNEGQNKIRVEEIVIGP